ncbi:hypothetical protein Chor_008220, partial [Crotalus horridus]
VLFLSPPPPHLPQTLLDETILKGVDESNALVLPSRKTQEKPATCLKRPEKKPLTKKQKKNLQKILEQKAKKEKVRSVQEASAGWSKKIKSIGGARRKRGRLELEEEEEEEEKEVEDSEEEEPLEQAFAEASTTTETESRKVSKSPLPLPKELDKISGQRNATTKPLSEPAVFVPVDRSPDIQVSFESNP